MRYAADHKEKTRARILESAAAAFRREGYHATGVDKVMEDAGLTAGGFYAHFPSKDALLAEALEHCVGTSGGPLDVSVSADENDEAYRAGAIVDRYLTAAHRAHPARGCPLPSLAAEVSRASSKTRKACERLVSDLIARLASGSPPDQADDPAIAIAALCVGGMTLARAVDDPEFSDRILAACRAFAHEGLRQPVRKTAKSTAGRPRAKPRAKRQ